MGIWKRIDMSDALDGQPGQSLRMDWGDLSNGIGTFVRLLRNELYPRILSVYEPFGLHSGAVSVMALIKGNPGCSQSEIAREVAMDDSAMVAIIDELEQRGLAQRTRSVTDRRRNSLSLTPEGERVMGEMIACAMTVEGPIQDALSEEELSTLMDLLRRSYSALIAAPRP